MMEWWTDGRMEWWNDEMMERLNDGMMKWWNNGMIEWWNDGMMECLNSGMIKIWNKSSLFFFAFIIISKLAMIFRDFLDKIEIFLISLWLSQSFVGLRENIHKQAPGHRQDPMRLCLNFYYGLQSASNGKRVYLKTNPK